MDMIFASNNPKKLSEIQDAFSAEHFRIFPQNVFFTGEAHETASTYVENALLKAHYCATRSTLPVLADDSGLEVDALGGAPGIFSARFAEPTATHEENMRKLLTELQNVPLEKRTARFRCVLVCLRFPSDPAPLICEGIWEGFICQEPKGNHGFGYDPVFWLDKHRCTVAELPQNIKTNISHRAQALQKMLSLLKQASWPDRSTHE